ncbi:MAG: hypothetical protein ABJM26_02570 [Anderseniella sp.]
MTSARQKRTRRVRRLALLLFSGYGLIASSAQASDWQMLYRLSDTVTGSDNIAQIVSSPGPAGSTDASAGLDINLITKSLTWGLTADIGYVTYFGDTELENVPRKSVKSDLEKKTRNTDYFVSAFYSIAPATTTEFTDLGIIENDIERLSYGADAGFNHRINKRDSLNFSIGVSRSDFTQAGDDVTPNRSVTASLVWVRQFNQRVNGNLKTSVNWYEADDPLNQTEFLIYKNTVGTDAKLTRRFSVTANAGAALIDNYQADPLFPALGRDRTMVYGFIGDFSLEYKPFNDTTFNFFLAQDVFTDDLGDLRASQSARFALNYRISDISSFNLSGGLSKSTGGEDDTDAPREVWNISPVYSHQLNKRWNSAIGYRFVQSNGIDEFGDPTPITSNTVFVSLSTNGALLP